MAVYNGHVAAGHRSKWRIAVEICNLLYLCYPVRCSEIWYKC